MNFLNELNVSQRNAVEYNEGALLVIAGAGSGKTRVLTYKIAHLLQSGFAPSSILALTFTNKAAREMKSRIAALVGERIARYLWMGTFHSVFSRILRTEATLLGYTKNFSIYDSADATALLKSIIKDLKLDDKVYKASVVYARISAAKNNLITPNVYANNADLYKSDAQAGLHRMGDIYHQYTARCKQSDAMDFDDLLLQTNLLLRDFPEVLAKYRSYFSYILVDEYQDTNYAQYLIVKRLAEKHENVCVVGDDAQSIYSFRGANIDNILQFVNQYQSSKVIKLERNYRSTQIIVNAANSLIEKNASQIPKKVYSENASGKKIPVIQLQSDMEEGIVVAKQIKDFISRSEYRYDQMAILYRTNAQSRVLEEELRKLAIPYRIYGGMSFYQRKEIKDVLAYCRLVVNPFDEESLRRIINVPARGIGDTTVQKLFESAATHQVRVWEVLSDLPSFSLPIHSGTSAKLTSFKQMIDAFALEKDSLNALSLLEKMVKETKIIQDTFADRSVENVDRQENIHELMNAIRLFCEAKNESGENALLSDFLAEVSLLTDQDTQPTDDTNFVTMMTVHAAKGLEFKVVFIVGLEEDLFPSLFSLESIKAIEEERRLLYVAITRAEEHCIISYARSRFRNGQLNITKPSRFLKDIDPSFLQFTTEHNTPTNSKNKYADHRFNELDSNVPTRPVWQSKRMESTPSNASTANPARRLKKVQPEPWSEVPANAQPTIPVGTFVKHPLFGIGKVIGVSHHDASEKAEIDFAEKGVKSLLLKFAKLEILD